MKKIIILSAMAISLVSKAQMFPLSLVGDNYILLNGERFNNQKIIFTKATGDWYTTSDDGHGIIEFVAPFDGRQLRLDIEWDGKKDFYIITNEVRHQQRKGECIITLPDKDTYGDGLNAYPNENKGIKEEVKIIVIAIDEMNLQAKISGNISNNNEHMLVSGMISLKKNVATKTSTTASYKDCDNVIHDKLVGAQFRSPTDCEIKFDFDLRSVLHLSFQPLIDSLLKKGWKIENETPVKAIAGIARGSEKNFYDPGLTDVGNYSIHFQLNPSSTEYKKWQNQYNDMMQDFQKNPTAPDAMNKLTSFTAEMKAATDISIHVNVNYSTTSAVNFTTNHSVEKIPNTTYIVHLKNAQAPTGGGKDDSRNAVWVYFGKWNNPKFIKNGDGSERVDETTTLDTKASHLSIQTIVLRMECSDELVNEILKYMDVEKLASLINH